MLERPRRLIIFLALASAMVASVALAGCFHDNGGGTSADAQKIINDTFSSDKNVDSGKLKLELEAKIDATGVAKTQIGDNPVKLTLNGPFQSTGDNTLPKFEFSLTASAAGQSFTAGAISTGKAGFISYQGTDYKLDAETFKDFRDNFEKEQAADQKDESASLSALGVDPKKWIKDAKDEGTADIGGTETVHVSATVDILAFLDDINSLLSKSGQLNLTKEQRQQLPKALTDAQKKQVQDAVTEARIDVYSGKDDKIMRKVEVTFKFNVPDSLKSQAQGINGGDIKLIAEITEVNKPQTIDAPKNAKSLKALQDVLGANPLGALGAGAGAGGSSAAPPTTGGDSGDSAAPDPEQAQKYLDCIGKAAGKPEEIQKCASQLQQQ